MNGEKANGSVTKKDVKNELNVSVGHQEVCTRLIHSLLGTTQVRSS